MNEPFSNQTPTDFSDTRAVRASEQLDWVRLENYVRAELQEKFDGEFDVSEPMKVEQFPGGHSNLTYLLRFGAEEFVMRRPPFGKLPPRAHDMAREFRILAAVNPVYPLAPRPFLLCEDAEITGSVFYLMERRGGIVVRTEEPAELKDKPDARRGVSRSVVEALAELHRIDVRAHGLDSLGKPAGFVERQVRGWSERWRGSQTTELPEMDFLAAWLIENLPPDAARPTLVHGDFKLDNVMLDWSDITKIVGVFDWEMAAIGDPLVDLGILLCYWIHVAQSEERDAVSTVTNRAGYFGRDEILELYAARTNFDLSNIKFYEIFAVFKLAVVAQQIFYRYHRGQTDDPRFANLDRRVAWLAQTAAALAR
jgi:aminoglycoside phosphotransferase (APT) family kinase protein